MDTSLIILVLLAVLTVLVLVQIFTKKSTSNSTTDNGKLETLNSQVLELSKEKATLEQQLSNEINKNTKLQSEFEETSTKYTALQAEYNSQREELTTAKTQNQSLQEKIKNDEEVLKLVKDEFSRIALETINEEGKTILDKNHEAVKVTLEPLNQQLSNFKKELTEYKDTQLKDSGELREKISMLAEKNDKLNEQANRLTEALTQNRNVKGWYGENLVKTILENSGFKEGIHFITQFVGISESKKIRPDFVVKLPDNRNVIIDSKTILDSIYNLTNSDNEIEEVSEVFKAVKTRVKELSGKEYETLQGYNQPEFVILFIPVEPIVNLLYTTKEGMDLIEESRRQRVIITGSVSLVTIINLIDRIWKESERTKNIDKIIEIARQLYESVAQHAIEFEEIRKSIDKAKDLTDMTMKRLTDEGRANVSITKQAQKLVECGIQNKKSIPQSLLNSDDTELLETELV